MTRDYRVAWTTLGTALQPMIWVLVIPLVFGTLAWFSPADDNHGMWLAPGVALLLLLGVWRSLLGSWRLGQTATPEAGGHWLRSLRWARVRLGLSGAALAGLQALAVAAIEVRWGAGRVLTLLAFLGAGATVGWLGLRQPPALRAALRAHAAVTDLIRRLVAQRVALMAGAGAGFALAFGGFVLSVGDHGMLPWRWLWLDLLVAGSALGWTAGRKQAAIAQELEAIRQW